MYQALVTPVQAILKHPNADRLEIAVVCNNHVVVGIGNYKPDDLVIFFETDGCLSEPYCTANDLYEKFQEVDGVKTRIGTGYLDPNGRVRALNLRSYKSNGLVMPLSSLDFLQFDRSVLKAGFSFSSLGGVEICKKYETPATRLARKAGQPKTPKLKTKTVFHEHVETQNFRRNIQAIPSGATITITEKQHGTCLMSDVRVSMANGVKKPIKDVQEGEYVLGFNEQTGQLQPSLVQRTLKWQPTNDWISVVYKGYYNLGNAEYKVKCTPEHQIYTANRGYVEAQHLTTDDIVLQCFEDYKLSNDHYQILLGKLLGDGYLNKKVRACVTFGQKVDHEDYIDYTLNSLGCMSGSRRKDYRVSGYGTKMIRVNTKFSYTAEQAFSELYNPERTITQKIADSIDWIAVAFWYMDDGSLAHSDKQEDRANFACCAYDEQSAQLLTNALVHLGLDNITLYKSEEKYWRIRINASSADVMFQNIAPYMSKCMAYKLPEHYQHLVTESYQFEDSKPCMYSIENKINRIETITNLRGNKSKYDLTTETGNFFASSMLVHNSGRVGYVYTEQETYNPFLSTVFNRLNLSTPWQPINKAYNWLRQTIEGKTKTTVKGCAYQHGTRKVLLKKDSNNTGYYGSDAFRWAIADRLLPMLRKGEEIYYEIVGETTTGAKIQPNHSTAATGDKKFIKAYGDEVSYNYGVPANTAKAYVYRICVTNEDGYQWELSWEAVKARCLELGVDHVPEWKVIHDYNPDNHINFGSQDLIDSVEALSLQSTFADQFPEGVVVRVDYQGKTWFLKEKNWYFLAMEGFMKDKPDYVDTEEIQS